jgi:hypothetical protein
MSFQAFINNDNALTLAGLKDACAGSFANSATVEVTVTDKDGVDVTFDNTSDFWPRPMPYIAASNGVYCGVIPLEAELVPERDYIAVITANEGGIRGRWNVHF